MILDSMADAEMQAEVTRERYISLDEIRYCLCSSSVSAG